MKKVKSPGNPAQSLNLPLAQLSIAWCIKNPNVSTVILGATKKDQLLENLGSLDIVSKLNDEVMQQIEDIVQTKPVLPEH